MKRRILGLLGGRRRRLLLATVISVAAMGAFLTPNALAVHNTGAFQLDGNAVTENPPPGDDWDRVCHQVTGSDCGTTSDTTGATGVSFTPEPNLNATIFTGGGSKDPQDVSNWLWKDGAGGLPDKDNLLDSFAARYTVSGSDYLFFGSDRFDNSGDAQQGFWFFQNKITADGPKSQGGNKFNGVHKNGDLLVISDFSNGGTTSSITVYKWNSGVSGNLEQLASSNTANCANPNPDTFCGIVNGSNGTTAPWSFTDKSGNNTYLQGEFYEGGINLSALNLANECFSSVASETRSSTSTTATLKDFVLGQFGNCSATMATQVKDSAGNAIPNTQTVTPGDAVHDTATITGSNPTKDPTGQVTFFMCSFSSGSTDVCDGSDTAHTGTQVGSPVSVTGNGNGIATANSDAVNSAIPLSAGRYCFRAEWPGDSNYVGALKEFSGATECFTVKDTSSISTAQNWRPQDTATVTTAGGTTVDGTVVFSLYENGTCTAPAAHTFTDASATSTGVFETSNTTVDYDASTVPAGGAISWSATFTPTDPNAVQGSTTTRCERSDLAINNSASAFPPPPTP